MNGLREFTSASEMMAFYRDLRARLRDAQPPRKAPPSLKPVTPTATEPVAPRPPLPMTPMNRIIKIVGDRFGVPRIELCSPDRRAEWVEARAVVAYFGRHLLNQSLNQIGRRLGYRDHTTILHGVRTVEKRIMVDVEFSCAIEELRKRLLEEPRP